MNTLYPLKFNPILKDLIWGGSKLRTILNKKDASDKCGESWEISDVEGNSSIVANGFLAGNTLGELVEIYMGDLVGDQVYERFNNEFPLLIKFIDANDKLSIQVHPDDEMAAEEHGGAGKTEMWYVMDAAPESELIVGFNKEIDKETYIKLLNENRLTEILNFEKVKPGDVFFLPAGRIHAICNGLLIAEIQQTSNYTYRIFDWNRTDAQGNPRELHTDLALKAMDFSVEKNYRTEYQEKRNQSINLVDCPYFTTNFLSFDKNITRDYYNIDSFVIYICLEGKFKIAGEEFEEISIQKGESVLIPAVLKNIELSPAAPSKIMEVYVS